MSALSTPLVPALTLLKKRPATVQSRPMAKEVVFGTRRFWILSEPSPDGWTASVVEIVNGERGTVEVGIEASGETRSAADDAAHGKLQRWLKGEQDAIDPE